MNNKNQYQELGVSSDKKEVHTATKTLDKGLFPNAFCKIFPDIFTNSKKYCLIAHADGAGTKASLAYIYWKQTGDLNVFRNLAIDAIVMNIDDMICVGAVGPYTFTQTIDRNSFTIPGEVIQAIIEGTKDFFEKMKRYDIDITYNGGETADVNDLVRTLTVNASMQARMLRKDVIDTTIKPGNIIVGLSSSGKAVYEDEYNSGIGSNGLTMARHKVLDSWHRHRSQESYEPLLQEKAYTGHFDLDSTMNAIPWMTIGKLMLSPTRTYAPLIKQLLMGFSKKHISALVHCSGGGQTKCLGFANSVHIIKDALFDIPPLFSLIQEESGEDWKNMYKTFNMGSRFEIYCNNQDVADWIITAGKYFDIDAQIIGRVEASDETKLTIKSPHGEFVYTK